MGSYETMAQMRMDPMLNSRIQSCVIEQAQGKDASAFTEAIMLNAMTITTMFTTVMHTDTIMSDAYESAEGVTDYMILVGVQSHWDEVETMWTSSQPVPAP